MKPTSIETHYGKFPTLHHYEYYWKDKVKEAFLKGFEEGIKFDKNIHK